MRYNLPLRRVHGQTELLMAPFYSFREFFHEFLLYHRLIPWCLVILFLAFGFSTRKVVMTLISPAHAARLVPVGLATRP